MHETDSIGCPIRIQYPLTGSYGDFFVPLNKKPVGLASNGDAAHAIGEQSMDAHSLLFNIFRRNRYRGL